MNKTEVFPKLKKNRRATDPRRPERPQQDKQRNKQSHRNPLSELLGAGRVWNPDKAHLGAAPRKKHYYHLQKSKVITEECI